VAALVSRTAGLACTAALVWVLATGSAGSPGHAPPTPLSPQPAPLTAEHLAPGVCRSLADPLRALGELTWRYRDGGDGRGGRLPAEQRRQLRPWSEQLMAARAATQVADPILAARLDSLIAAVGAVRLLATGASDGPLLIAIDADRLAVLARCTLH
jgi:hypothetical protein